MNKLFFSILLFITVSSFAKDDTLYFPPCLKLIVKENTWYKSFNYSKAMFSPSIITLQHKQYKDIELDIEIDKIIVENLNQDSLTKELKINLKENKINNGYSLNNCFIYYQTYNSSGTKEPDNYIKYYLAKTDGKNVAVFGIKAPIKFKPDLKILIDDIAQKISFTTINEIDKFYGYPIPYKITDSVLKVDNNKYLEAYKKLYQIKDADNETLESLKEDLKSFIEKCAYFEYSFEKYYNVEEKIKSGDYPIDDWLSYILQHKKFEDLEFYIAFDGDMHGEASVGSEIALSKYVKALLENNDTTRLYTECHNVVTVPNKTENLYWTNINYQIGNGQPKLLLCCFQYINNHWINHYQIINEDQNLYNTSLRKIVDFTQADYERTQTYYAQSEPEETVEESESDTAVNYEVKTPEPNVVDENGLIEIKPDSTQYLQKLIEVENDDFLVLENDKWKYTYVLNNKNPSSNFVKMDFENKTNSYDVLFANISPSYNINYTNINTVLFNEYADAKKQAKYILSTPTILNELSTSEYTTFDDNYKVLIDTSKLIKEAYPYILKNILPHKRVYGSALIHGDINKNGIPDVYAYYISNGKLLSYQVVEAKNDGVEILPNNSTIEKEIINTEHFIELKKLSLNIKNTISKY